MKTSQEWWNETKVSPEAINAWLQKQYTGEVTAADRIEQFSGLYATNDKDIKVLTVIAEQERTHASWIKGLLEARGINPEVGDAHERYWKETLPGINDFHTGAAVAAHAEKMRLDRITVISQDETAEADIRDVFKRILKDELFHERAFRNMSTEAALVLTLADHEAGAKALGLVA